MYSITFDEVKQYVESLADGVPVGICNNPYHCIIANAIWQKYPDLLTVEVTPHRFSTAIDMCVTETSGEQQTVTSPDLPQLNTLALAFDRLGAYNRPTKDEVLPLFKE